MDCLFDKLPPWFEPTPRIQYGCPFVTGLLLPYGPISKDSKQHCSKRGARWLDAAVRQKTTTHYHIKLVPAQSGGGCLSSLWVRSPAKGLSGNSEETNKALRSVKITFGLISYKNKQHLATSVLTCWKGNLFLGFMVSWQEVRHSRERENSQILALWKKIRVVGRGTSVTSLYSM